MSLITGRALIPVGIGLISGLCLRHSIVPSIVGSLSGYLCGKIIKVVWISIRDHRQKANDNNDENHKTVKNYKALLGILGIFSCIIVFKAICTGFNFTAKILSVNEQASLSYNIITSLFLLRIV